MQDGSTLKLTDDVISAVVAEAHLNPSFIPSVTAIRANQHHHERAWHEARSLITAKYETKRRLNTLLTRAGGSEGVTSADLEKAEQMELKAYDEKVRVTMLRMYVAQQEELKKLGVRVLRDEEAMRRVYRVLEELCTTSNQ